MNIEQATQEGLKVSLKVTIPAAIITSKINTQLQTLANTRSIKGYRKGKAPLTVLQQKVGNQIVNQVNEEQIREGVKQAISSYKVYGTPEIVELKTPAGQDLSFTLSFEITPEITIPSFSGTSLIQPEIQFSAEDIAKQLLKEQRSIAKFKTREPAEIALEDDTLQLHITKIVANDNEVTLSPPINSYFNLQDEHILFAKNRQEFIGCKIDEERTITVTISQDLEEYDQKYQPLHQYIGQTIQLQVKVVAIQQVTLPELNDEQLLQRLNCNTPEEINNAVEKLLQTAAQQEIYTLLKIRLFNILEHMLSYEVPEALLKQEIANLKHHLNDQPADDPNSELLLKKLALRRARIAMLLAHYAEVNKLQATEDDIRAFILDQVKRSPWMGKQILEFYNTNQAAVTYLANNILEDKAVKMILDKEITINKAAITLAEFEALLEQEGDIYKYQLATAM